MVRGTGFWRVHSPSAADADFPKLFRRTVDWRVWQVRVYQRDNHGGIVCIDVGSKGDSGG